MDICKHNDQCGGCIYQGIPYQDQLILKGKDVVRLMKEKEVTFQKNLGIEGSPKQYRYRNKMEYTFGDEVKDGPLTLGMHESGKFMNIVTVDECQLVDEDFNLILKAALEFCKEKAYKAYHKKSHKGILRHLIVRKGENTSELLVNLITSTQLTESGEAFDDGGFVAVLSNLPLQNSLVGILHTYNDNLADFVKCDRMEILQGRDYYLEKVMGLQFQVSAFSFFQTNITAIERLYTEAISLIKDLNGKTVYDLYCGTGTITQILALRAKKAIGIELVEESVAAAKENARLNGLENCEFIAGDVFEKLDQVEQKPDVIVVDPPRVGIHPKALEKIISYGVEQIVYISCNPKSLAENLSVMQMSGYEVKSVKAYDNFPMSGHVECVCLLQRAER